MEPIYANIPDNVNVLITHCGAYGCLDKTGDGKHLGSIALRDRIWNLSKLILHAFGHVHASFGEQAAYAGYEAAHNVDSTLKKCKAAGGRDTRVVRRGSVLFSNAAALKVNAGQQLTAVPSRQQLITGGYP